MKRLVPIGLSLLLLVFSALALQGCSSSRYIAKTVGSSPMSAAAEPMNRRGAATLGFGEELWVIERRAESAPRAEAPGETPGSGALMAKLPGEQTLVGVPLKHTAVKANIAGYIGSVDVTQQYHNPWSVKIEATYLFPLPHNAAVNEFVMTIGERRIRGIIREREEAQRIYQDARQQGYVASLLTQERPNIFTQKVANIEPGKQIDVNIRYFHTLTYADGWFEFVFPMVVGPRFNPPGFSEGIGAVGRGGAGLSGQTTEVQYLRPEERSGHDLSLAVEIDAGVPIDNLQCRSHNIVVKTREGSRASVALAANDRIPNKDFVLRFQVAGKAPRSAVFAQKSGKGGYFSLMLLPPQGLSDAPRQPLEMVFTLDTSGSMSGKPIEQSKAAMRHALTRMDANDTFQVIRFGDQAEKLFSAPRPATAENVREAMAYIERTRAGSGTMMVEGIRASLDFPHDPRRLRVVAFLTDGYIGNEAEVLKEIHQKLGPARIFSFGVGSSTNRFLMEHMARMGNGAAAFLGWNDPAEEVMGAFFERISHPGMTDLAIDFGEMGATDVYPQRLPDLLVGRPVIVTGRFNGKSATTVKVRGRIGDKPHEMAVAVNLDDAGSAHAALAPIWARARLADLCDDATWQPNKELASQIRQVALEYGLMSEYTAFVAVDSSVRTSGDHGISVPVPVPVPDGVRYDTTVIERPGQTPENDAP